MTYTEKWKSVDNFDRYEVSNLGKIRLLRSSRLLRIQFNRCGYRNIALCNDVERKTLSIHRLVAIAFMHNPDKKKTINHIDGDKTNNKVDNLEWSTYQENMNHAMETGLINNGKKIVMIGLDGEEKNVFNSGLEAERLTGINQGNISSCCLGRRKTTGGFRWRFLNE